MSAGIDPQRVAQAAVRNFVEDSYNCAESVVAAFSAVRGEPPRALTPLVTAFGGGVGGLGHMCGAISGALAVMGRRAGELGLSKGDVRAIAQRLHVGFDRRFGTTSCRELTRHDCEAAGGAPFELRQCGKYLEHVVGGTIDLLAPFEAARAAREPAHAGTGSKET